MTAKERREIMEAASRYRTDPRERFLVANNSVQGWSVCGYADLRIALQLSYSLAVEAVKWGHPEVYMLDKELGRSCRIQIERA